MFDYITKLQKKSEATRKRIAFLFAFCSTLIIFLIWLIAQPAQEEVAQESQTENSPLQSLGAGFSQIFAGAKEEFRAVTRDAWDEFQQLSEEAFSTATTVGSTTTLEEAQNASSSVDEENATVTTTEEGL